LLAISYLHKSTRLVLVCEDIRHTPFQIDPEELSLASIVGANANPNAININIGNLFMDFLLITHNSAQFQPLSAALRRDAAFFYCSIMCLTIKIFIYYYLKSVLQISPHKLENMKLDIKKKPIKRFTAVNWLLNNYIL
jgi:hypothetical protein